MICLCDVNSTRTTTSKATKKIHFCFLKSALFPAQRKNTATQPTIGQPNFKLNVDEVSTIQPEPDSQCGLDEYDRIDGVDVEGQTARVLLERSLSRDVHLRGRDGFGGASVRRDRLGETMHGVCGGRLDDFVGGLEAVT